MRWSLVVIVFAVWAAGLLTSTTLGGLIHLLPLLVLAAALAGALRRRGQASGAAGSTPWSMAMAGAAATSVLWLAIAPRQVEAYTVSALIGAGCHELITSDALRAVRLQLVTAAPLPATKDERALVSDLEFVPAADMRDLGGATLLVGVRDNDLKGKASDDLSLLGQVHGDPANQEEHCLRTAAQDEPGGSAAALADCRTFIRGRIVQALDGLDSAGAPDPAVRVSLPLHLTLRGGVDALLPTFYVRMGQALHAVEDSFSHTYRTPDGMKITVILNWIDESARTLVESRDGPAHTSAMDVCNDPDPLRTTRRRLATEATTALLQATLDPLQTKEQKMATVDGLLDTYLSYSPGCTFDNGWCDAPEHLLKDKATSTFGCSSGGGGALGGLGLVVVLSLFARRRRSLGTAAAALLVLAALALPPARAGAAEPAETEPAKSAAVVEAEKHEPPAPVVVPVVQPGPKDPSEGAWGGEFSLAGAVDKPAGAVTLGLRRKLSTHWTVGWDAEWNPWINKYGSTALQSGVANTFGTIILRFPLAYENFNLRTTVNLGLSYLLFDLYGAPKGSLGYYAAISPLGVEWKISRMFFLIFNPLSMAVAVPQTKGVPLVYLQYRISIGLGIMAG
jgi:MYXO-CTERM domain-containing protein